MNLALSTDELRLLYQRAEQAEVDLAAERDARAKDRDELQARCAENLERARRAEAGLEAAAVFVAALTQGRRG